MPTKLAKRTCFNCSKPFRPARHQQTYCTRVCTEGARRVRAREAARGLGRASGGFGDGGPAKTGPAVQGACQQCGKRKRLRFDAFGPVNDEMIEAEPAYCSAACAARYWQAQAQAPGPDQACEGLRRLIDPKRDRRERRDAEADAEARALDELEWSDPDDDEDDENQAPDQG